MKAAGVEELTNHLTRLLATIGELSAMSDDKVIAFLYPFYLSCKFSNGPYIPSNLNRIEVHRHKKGISLRVGEITKFYRGNADTTLLLIRAFTISVRNEDGKLEMQPHETETRLMRQVKVLNLL